MQLKKVVLLKKSKVSITKSQKNDLFRTKWAFFQGNLNLKRYPYSTNFSVSTQIREKFPYLDSPLYLLFDFEPSKIAGTGSETTGVAIFDHLEMNAKIGIGNRALKPTLGLIDPAHLQYVPNQVTAFTGFDVLCHALERRGSLSYKSFFIFL